MAVFLPEDSIMISYDTREKRTIMRHLRGIFAASLITASLAPLHAQDIRPINDAPNPYTTITDFFKLPAGRAWGSTSAVGIDKDGKSVWIAERCGANSCLDRATGKVLDIPTVMKFDANGKLVTSFGNGMLVFPMDFMWIATAISGSPTARITLPPLQAEAVAEPVAVVAGVPLRPLRPARALALPSATRFSNLAPKARFC